MIELQNINKITIPSNPDKEWIWTRILISINFFVLKKPTALQWSLMKILTNLDKINSEVTTDLVAKKLAVEKSIVEDGLTTLIEDGLISLVPRKKANLFQNYIIKEQIQDTFNKFELITLAKQNKKILLFYDYKDERTYSYQPVEKPEDDVEQEIAESVFDLILLAVIEHLGKVLDENPHSLVGEIDYSSVKQHNLLKGIKSILIESIHVNFL